MKRPKRLDFSPEEVEALISRIENQQLEATDFPLLADLVRAMIWMESSLREKQLSIARLKAIFGIKTESAIKLSELLGKALPGDENSAENNQQSTEKVAEENIPSENHIEEDIQAKNTLGAENAIAGGTAKEPPKGHGHRPSSDYQEAEPIFVELCRIAANAECIHNDDTTARILDP